MDHHDLEFRQRAPEPALADFVESYWMLANHADADREIVILPDGRIDLSFSCASQIPFRATMLGLESEPHGTHFAAATVIFAVSLKLLAIEYLGFDSIASLLNHAQPLPDGFWKIGATDLHDFDAFCAKVSAQIKSRLTKPIDERKRKLFHNIYTTQGSLTVAAYSDHACWTSRQINRYFDQYFGLTLKAYCNILRFRATFKDLKEGNLAPSQNYADQAHFIKEVKKYAGVVPKMLARNKNDRFIQFSVLPPE